MPTEELPKTGLRKPGQDFGWDAEINAGFDEFESRMGLTCVGDPNDQVDGSWYGQRCFDTNGELLYECTQPGPASSAVWVLVQRDEPGTFKLFMRATLPEGWLPFDGVARSKDDYPGLYAVLPAAYKSAFSFTLPDLSGQRRAIMVGGGGAAGDLVGSANTNAVSGGTPAGTNSIPDVSGVVRSVGTGPPYYSVYDTDDILVSASIFDGAPLAAHSHTVDPFGLRVLAGIKF